MALSAVSVWTEFKPWEPTGFDLEFHGLVIFIDFTKSLRSTWSRSYNIIQKSNYHILTRDDSTNVRVGQYFLDRFLLRRLLGIYRSHWLGFESRESIADPFLTYRCARMTTSSSFSSSDFLPVSGIVILGCVDFIRRQIRTRYGLAVSALPFLLASFNSD